MNAESLTWVAIGLASAAYISHRHMQQKPKVIYAPSAQKEVDPTRWRHDGTQPIAQHDGNHRIDRDTYAERELQMMLYP